LGPALYKGFGIPRSRLFAESGSKFRTGEKTPCTMPGTATSTLDRIVTFQNKNFLCLFFFFGGVHFGPLA
jgi:hypothetical protein